MSYVSKVLFLISFFMVKVPLAYAMEGETDAQQRQTVQRHRSASTASGEELKLENAKSKKSKTCCGGLCYLRPVGRIVHNIRTESWRGVECAWNFLHCRGWHYNDRLRKMAEQQKAKELAQR